MAGPWFATRISIAIHDPTRACPSISTLASTVNPAGASTAVTGATASPASSTTASDARTNGEARTDVGRRTQAPMANWWEDPSKDARPPRKVALRARPARCEGRPLMVAVGAGPIVRWGRPTSRRSARRHPEEPLPQIRPFRALRFDRSVVGDPGLVVAPPYDVIGAELRAT